MAANRTQSFVPVQEVRNGVMILKDGGLRSVLMASSINFALKSEDEQNAIVGAFQTFLNTLDFSVQILVHSRELDIRPYLELLHAKEQQQNSDLMKLQLREYTKFVERFVDQTSVMRKHFYVVVPYQGISAPDVTSSIPFFGGKKNENQEDQRFLQQVSQLDQRVAVVQQGLAAAGVRTQQLDTEAILELLYRAFNPGVFETPIQIEQQ
ncbi:MAG: TraC family protein [Patescibacteria group bacterium UBA2103]